MVIANAQTGEAVGGGMCQFSNLIHWMVLHAPLTITEQHHHDQFDLFPDFGRQVPFGTGTSIFYNYLDYRFHNDTEQTYQLLVHTTPTHLCGELRTDAPLAVKYHIAAENERFMREDGVVYRCGEVYRTMVDKTTGNVLSRAAAAQPCPRALRYGGTGDHGPVKKKASRSRGAFFFEDFGNFLLLCCTRRDKRGILRRITTNETMRRYDAY